MVIEELLAEVAALKAQVAERDAQLAERDVQLAQRDAQIAALMARLVDRDAEVVRLRSDVEEIRRLLRRNSTNSSSPPSKDPPGTAHPKKKPGSGKKRGGQPGHKGHSRAKAPAERVDRHVAVPIAGPCSHCGSEKVCGRHTGRTHQSFELPELRATVTEWKLESGRCGGCERRRSAPVPPEMPRGCLGPRAQALVATLTGTFQLSRRDAERFLSEVMGIEISLGTVSSTEQVVSEALKPAHEEAIIALRQQPVAAVDETGHRRAGERSTTWVGTSPLIAAFLVGVRRARTVFHQLFGEDFSGVLTTDRYVVYDVIPPDRRQLCWAHLKRTFKALVDEGGEAARIGRRLLDGTKTALAAVREHRAGSLLDDAFEHVISGVKRGMLGLLSDNRDLIGLKTIHEAFVLTPQSVWLFTTRSDVDATNNMAERDLRRFVIWRKTSFGSQSERGDHFMERTLTAVVSCRKQKRPLFEFFVDAVRAAVVPGHARPSLLPRLPQPGT